MKSGGVVDLQFASVMKVSSLDVVDQPVRITMRYHVVQICSVQYRCC